LSLKDQLPCLGDEQGDGTIKIDDNITIENDKLFKFRPDYEKFKSKVLQSESCCASVLIGINRVEAAKQQVDKIVNDLAKKENIFFDEIMKYPEGQTWFEFDSIMQELREIIDIGTKSGRIEVQDLKEDPLLKNVFFKNHIYYEPKQFIKWAEENSYKIPVELQLVKKKDGILYWLVGETQNDQIKTAKIQKNDIRGIVIEYVDNTEIKITVKKNDTRNLNAGALGFDLSKGRVAWDVLIAILDQPPHKYYCGYCRTEKEKTEYSKKYDKLRQISKKLIENFFNKELGLTLPPNNSLFESVINETGVFKPIFKVKDRSTLALCSSKGDFNFKIPTALTQATNNPTNVNRQQFLIDLLTDAKNKGYINSIQKQEYETEAIEAAKRIIQARENEEFDDQPDIMSQNPNIISVENIDDYSNTY